MRFMFIVFLLITMAFSQNSAINSYIEIPNNTFKKNDNIKVWFIVENTGESDLVFCRYYTPFEGFGGDIFQVTIDGKKVEYIGKLIKRSPPREEDYITLKAGETKSIELNLEDGYNIYQKGNYEISYPGIGYNSENETTSVKGKKVEKINKSRLGRFELIEDKQSKIKKNSSQSGIYSDSSLKYATVPTCSECSSTELGNIQSAYSSAVDLVTTARFDLQETPVTSRNNAPRYREWFGSYDFTRFRDVTNHMQEIYRTLYTEQVNFRKIPSSDPNYYAFAYCFPAYPYTIYLGRAFWGAPVTGKDSKAGTIIHELSHFYVVASTSDVKYGQTDCRSLASNNPSDAIRNADSHEYFCENTPSLTMPNDSRVLSDFNDDGRADLLFFEPSNNSILVNMSTGTGFFGPGTGQWIGQNGFGSIKENYYPGDYNGDGITDLGYIESDNSFWVNISTGTGFGGPGSGRWLALSSWVWGSGKYYTGDFNGDGKSDLMFFRSSDNSIYITLSTGTTFNALHSDRWILPNGFGSLKDNYFPADFDGDGFTDLGYLESDNSFYVTLSTGTGFGAIGSGRWIAPNEFGGPYGSYYVGYFNNDMRADLMFFDPSDNSIRVRTSSGRIFYSATQWVAPNSFGNLRNNYFPADFNGDRMTDLGYLGSDNSFQVRISTGSSFTLSGNGTPWISSNSWGGSWGKYYVGDCLNRK